MRKKVFASIVFLVTMLFAVVGWAAVYYLSLSGSATPPYDTWEKAANSLNQILNLDLTGENTIYVAEGTYSGSSNYIALTSSKFCDLSIIGRGNVDRIVFDPGTTSSCYIEAGVDNVKFENITIRNNASVVANIYDGTNIMFTGCKLIASSDHHYVNIYLRNNSTATFQYCIITTESYDTVDLVYMTADSAASFHYCLFYSPNGSPGKVVEYVSSQSTSIINCIVAKACKELILLRGTGSLELSNDIFLAGGWSRFNYPIIRRTDGECNIKNSVVLPSTLYPKQYVDNTVTVQNMINTDPRLKISTWGVIVPRVDDTDNVDYVISLANVLAEYGYKGSYFLPSIYADTVADKLRTLIQGGVMEVGGHTYCHQNLTYDHALHFEYTGSDANPTVELDSSRVIHLRTDGSDDVDIDTTQANADTLGEIIDNFSGTNNWTISYSTTDGQLEAGFRDDCKAESLAEMPATAAPCDIDFLKETNCENGNCEGLYKTEIYEPKFQLASIINSEGNVIDPQTGQVYEVRTYVPPFGAGDNNLVEALRTSGYIGASGITNISDEALPHNVFKTTTTTITELIVDGDEEQTTKNAELFAINVAINKLVVTLLSHNESQATMEEWRWILNGFKRAQEAGYNIQVTSLQLAIEALKRLGTYDPSTGDVDIQWAMPSFRLRYDSPCIDAGIKLPIHDENWRDLAGNRIRYGTAPDIGCYEHKTWPRGAWGMLPWVGNSYKVQWTSYE